MAMRRFEIAQQSMLPNLRPGDEVVAVDTRPPRVGDVVVFEHPERDGFWVIKRMAEPPHPIDDSQAWVVSDNPEVTRADSRTLGALDRATLWPIVERLDADTFADACELLSDEDEDLARILDTHGLPRFWERRPGFSTLVWLILEQQVSLESGAAVYERLHRAAGSITPATVAELGPEELRSIGITRQKTAYLLGLAEAIIHERTSLESIEGLPPGDAREVLLAIRGIGPWTADAYLLSALRHPDVFPVGDRALQVGTGEALRMKATPRPDELELISEPWRPVRAVAARIIWHGYLSQRGRVEPLDPTVVHTPPRDA